MTDGNYARVYWHVMDDEKFDGIRDDPRLFGSWALLLVVADMAWPASAFVPPYIPQRTVKLLEDHGLITTAPGWRFRVNGLDKERGQRSNKARDAAAMRWHGASNAPSNAEPMPSRAEQSKSRAEQPARDGLPNLDSTVAKLWEQATGRSVLSSGNYAAEYLDDVCRRHPKAEVGAAIIRARKEFDHIPDGPSMVSSMRRILDPFVDPKAAAAKEREREQRAASSRAVEATLRRNHETGFHEKAREPRCPLCSEDAA